MKSYSSILKCTSDSLFRVHVASKYVAEVFKVMNTFNLLMVQGQDGACMSIFVKYRELNLFNINVPRGEHEKRARPQWQIMDACQMWVTGQNLNTFHGSKGTVASHPDSATTTSVCSPGQERLYSYRGRKRYGGYPNVYFPRN